MKWALLITILSVQSCGDSNSPKKNGNPPKTPEKKSITRSLASDYPWVGLILYQDQLRCTGTIVKPGVILTARHCFDHGVGKEIGNITVKLEKKTGEGKEERLTITKILTLDFDSAENDLAWIQYDRTQTDSWTEIAPIEVDRTKIPTTGTNLVVIGYPTTSDGRLLKLITTNCSRLAKEGAIPPLPEDPGYLGTLYDTNCIAWKGNSGGPFFTITSKGDTFELDQLIGVVTHTFDLNSQGGILTSALGEDQFGTYVKTVNFTSILSSADFSKYLP
jgi:hypothetical protein